MDPVQVFCADCRQPIQGHPDIPYVTNRDGRSVTFVCHTHYTQRTGKTW